jgi:hypothetical protein
MINNELFRYYYKDGLKHREDGPAVESLWGDKYWWIEGKLHREDGPAIIFNNTREEWWYRGKRHREDGPAIINLEGSKEWYYNGELHRIDGPAIDSGDIKMWYCHGDLHRLDGPAIDYILEPRLCRWFLFGKSYDKKVFYKVRNIAYKFISSLKRRIRKRMLNDLYGVGVSKFVAERVSEFMY